MDVLMKFVLITILTVFCVKCEIEQEPSIASLESLSALKQIKGKTKLTGLLIKPTYITSPTFVLTNQTFGAEFVNLKWLYIFNYLGEIQSDSFSNVAENIDNLVLFGNRIKYIDKGTFAFIKHLSYLSLENNGIEFLNEKAFVHVNIVTLDLSFNKLQRIKKRSFVDKSTITKLILNHNYLQQISFEEYMSRNLKTLYLNYNKMKNMSNFKLFTSLEELSLSHNKLNNVSDLSKLNSLTKLDISFNKLTQINDEFDALTNLKYLNLGGNELSNFEFTPAIVKIIESSSDLTLNLAFNNIRNLNFPEEMDTAFTISLVGNPWNCNCRERIERELKKNPLISLTKCDLAVAAAGELPYCFVIDLPTESCSDDFLTESDLLKFKPVVLSHLQDVSCDLFV